MAKAVSLTPAQAAYFVEFIDDLYAEQAVEVDRRMALFYAAARLDGASALGSLVDAPGESIGIFNSARTRYEGLMDGAPGDVAEEARLAHAQVLIAVRKRQRGSAH